jgi:hypothetical protein
MDSFLLGVFEYRGVSHIGTNCPLELDARLRYLACMIEIPSAGRRHQIGNHGDTGDSVGLLAPQIIRLSVKTLS